MEMIQGSPRVVSERIRVSPKVVSFWVLIEWRRPRVLLMRIMGTVGFTRSCNADGHNGALKAMMCIRCHITPLGSYKVRSR